MQSDTFEDKESMNSRIREIPRIGLDFGGVITKMSNGRFGRNELLSNTPTQLLVPQPDVFQVVRELVEISGGNLWIISKAGIRMQQLTLGWLDEIGFYGFTNLDPGHVRFCLKLTEKQIHCEELGITHYVDDRIHVMQILEGTVDNLYFFTDAPGQKRLPRFVTEVCGWKGVHEALVKNLARDPGT